MRICILMGVLLAAATSTSIAGPRVMAAPLSVACALLTPEQVGDALGGQVGAGKYVSPGFTKTCTWTAPGVIVTLMLQSVEAFQAGKSAPAPSVVTAVSGLGDDAYYLTVGNIVGLGVKNRTAAFKVTVYGSNVPMEKKQTIEKTLAQQALTKL
jgi:hypothetical protein